MNIPLTLPRVLSSHGLLLQLRCNLPLLIKARCYQTSTDQAGNVNDFKLIYKWPLIRHFRFIARLKTYQAGFMVLSLPPLSYLYSTGTVPISSLVQGGCAAGGTILLLCALSYGFSRIVGELRFNERTDTLLISHLNFIGSKQTHSVDINDIVPFEDIHGSYDIKNQAAMLKLVFEGRRRSLYYSLRYGLITDRELLRKALSLNNL